MKYHVLYVSLTGLDALLEDLNATQPANPIVQPVRVFPSPPGEKVKVELTEWEYSRLVNKDLAEKYK